MKKLFLAAMLVMASVAMVMAQPRAIGGRLGCGAEFSYEHQLGQNMLSIDAGFLVGPSDTFIPGVEGVVTYDWINPFGTSVPWEERGEWNWYMGVGAGAGAYFMKHLSGELGEVTIADINNNVFVGVAGRFGIEYNFWFPLQLSLDWRPVVGPTFNLYTHKIGNEIQVQKMNVSYSAAGLFVGGIALGVRYKF